MRLSLNPEFLVAFMFATIRCGAWLSIAPPFQGSVPVRIRTGLSMGLGLAMAPRLMQGDTVRSGGSTAHSARPCCSLPTAT